MRRLLLAVSVTIAAVLAGLFAYLWPTAAPGTRATSATVITMGTLMTVRPSYGNLTVIVEEPLAVEETFKEVFGRGSPTLLDAFRKVVDTERRSRQ